MKVSTALQYQCEALDIGLTCYVFESEPENCGDYYLMLVDSATGHARPAVSPTVIEKWIKAEGRGPTWN